jgi:hypothetical protein
MGDLEGKTKVKGAFGASFVRESDLPIWIKTYNDGFETIAWLRKFCL